MIPMPETEDEETGVPDPNAAASAAAAEWRRKHWNAENAAVDRVIAMLTDTKRADAGKAMETKKTWRDQKFALNMSVKKALAERGPQAKAAILAELGQLLKKKVWHPISMATLSYAQRRTMLRSKMFLKDKFLSTGSFEKFKARLVAGGDKQDKGLYDDLSSPTAATSSVFAVSAIAAYQRRACMSLDITGAYLHADLPKEGVIVRMRIEPVIAAILRDLDTTYTDGSVVVELDKALYGCVEAAKLWYQHLSSTLAAMGFVPNVEDPCAFNRSNKRGQQTTAVFHVDDLLITTEGEKADLQSFEDEIRATYSELSVHHGPVLSYLGMTFDWRKEAEVRIHRQLARLLYLANCTRPEILCAVAFMSTRVNNTDADDLAKCRRVLKYLRRTRDRGIVLKPGCMGI